MRTNGAPLPRRRRGAGRRQPRGPVAGLALAILATVAAQALADPVQSIPGPAPPAQADPAQADPAQADPAQADPAQPDPMGVDAAQLGPARFAERSAALGIDFVHRHFGTGEKYMHENMSPGVAVFDYDGDGRLDIYLVQGSALRPPGVSPPAAERVTNRLFRQRADGTFEDTTEAAGLGDTGYGMGAAFGDYDGDGDVDLYVTNYGANALYRNLGDGTFTEAGAEAGVAGTAWSLSAGFFDADEDLDLDLFVVQYVDSSFDHNLWCGNAQTRLRAYCHPDLYDGLTDVFYRNNGDGTFTEANREAGIVSSASDKGLGLGLADLDGDGHQDIYVANDATMNYLYLGDGTGRFEESSLLAGTGFNGNGAAESSMGVAIGDLDGDGRPEIFITHLDEETNTLYHNLGDGLFEDVTDAAGLAVPSLPWVGFSTRFLDHDNDGDLDIFVTNGHIIDNIEEFEASRAYLQPSQLFENLGGLRFVELPGALGLTERLAGRGAAAADLDRDGDLDLVVTQNNGLARVLINETGAAAGRHLTVRLRGLPGRVEGFGAVLELRTGSGLQYRQMQSSTGYLSQEPAEVFFGLGDRDRVDSLTVAWPGGPTRRYLGLRAGVLYLVPEEPNPPVPRSVSEISSAGSN